MNNDSATLFQGDHVTTPIGPGRVVLIARQDSSDEPYVMVRLDTKRNHPTYSGTMFPMQDVTLMKRKSLINDVSDMFRSLTFRNAS